MLLLYKILSSSMTIIIITEMAKRYVGLGGLIAVLPVNIFLSIIWLYLEKKDIQMLENFTYSAFLGIFPTMFFLLSITILFNKTNAFIPSVLIGLFILCVFVVLQHKILSYI